MSLFPYSGAHAVQSAAFALEWNDELSDAELAAISAAHDQLKSSLPNSAPIQAFLVQMGHISGTNPISTSSTAGYVFSRQGSVGPARALEIHRNRIVGQVNDYTRWEPVWNEVKSWFATVCPLINRRIISNVGLQYNDIFHWRDSPQSLDLKAVFKEDSPLLPKNIFDLSGLWHSHHGYFMDMLEPMQHRLLENVNVGIIEELGQRSIVITTVHKAEISHNWCWDDLSKQIDPLMASMHSRNKQALGNLLSSNAADMISLNKGAN